MNENHAGFRRGAANPRHDGESWWMTARQAAPNPPCEKTLRPVFFCRVGQAEQKKPFARLKPWREAYAGWIRRNAP
jgi:hypothetical protein